MRTDGVRGTLSEMTVQLERIAQGVCYDEEIVVSICEKVSDIEPN